MRGWLDKRPRLKELLELAGRIEDENHIHAPYIRLAPFVPSDADRLEQNLARLDSRAWEGFVEKIHKQLRTQRGSDGRRQFWELVNESRGYVWLADHGYTEIGFVPEEDAERADLIAQSPTRAILEVKTVNRSDNVAGSDRRKVGGA